MVDWKLKIPEAGMNQSTSIISPFISINTRTGTGGRVAIFFVPKKRYCVIKSYLWLVSLQKIFSLDERLTISQ
jgi:hypothetical protein